MECTWGRTCCSVKHLGKPGKLKSEGLQCGISKDRLREREANWLIDLQRAGDIFHGSWCWEPVGF